MLLSSVRSFRGNPERISDRRAGHEAALAAADRAWDAGGLDFTDLEDDLATLLTAQLEDG